MRKQKIKKCTHRSADADVTSVADSVTSVVYVQQTFVTFVADAVTSLVNARDNNVTFVADTDTSVLIVRVEEAEVGSISRIME